MCKKTSGFSYLKEEEKLFQCGSILNLDKAFKGNQRNISIKIPKGQIRKIEKFLQIKCL